MDTNKTIHPRVVVFGANGGIGKPTVEQALYRGHPVVAIVRNPAVFTLRHPALTIRKADVMAPETLNGILEKEDVVISAIGKNSTAETTLYSAGDKHILRAMTQAGTTRLFVISASGLEVNPTHNFLIRWATTSILQRILKHMYADLLRMEDIVKASAVNWTIMRPPQLTNGALTGKYRSSVGTFVPKGMKIARADVADFMLRSIHDETIFKDTVELAY
ncbi:NAD(P)-dependent oxidoreductase [Dawidia soli]|uniref:NAD(P)H-binding protein n=1 Tax=Dawidia soli TaxID=2782352 RepID=A0AAP2GGG2_9BACT|nr:NAD(P)H-binding protein [Dawidia soli]MBT1684983.1 NAD(P)H-binding protein [Dawidia soli]